MKKIVLWLRTIFFVGKCRIKKKIVELMYLDKKMAEEMTKENTKGEYL